MDLEGDDGDGALLELGEACGVGKGEEEEEEEDDDDDDD